MAMAFLLFMTPGIIFIQHQALLIAFTHISAIAAFEIFQFTRNQNKQIHKWLQTLAVLCMIAGYVIIYDCHSVLSDHGLALSTHSIIGYIAISLVTISYFMGFTMYVLKFGGSLRGELKPLHKRLGLSALTMGYVAMLMGFTEKANGFEGHTLVFAQYIIGLMAVTFMFVSFSIVKFVDKKEGFSYKSISNQREAGIVRLMQ